MQPQPDLGSVIAGRYRLVRELGRGGMGVVLEAENTITGRAVAVKWLHPSLAGNQEAAQRLMREATATCRIRHPNVVDVYDVICEGDAIYLVMELLQGEPLEAVLERGGVPFHEPIALLLPAMHGVAEAHRLGIIHRDIHPANIFVCRAAHDPRPVPKVLDFGISKIGGDGPSLTRSGTTLGTPLYMSYEQLCSARDVDQRADVYSFGVILYEALTGRPPFQGETFAELAVKIATGTPVPPKQLVPALPTALERIILWAIARERADRIPDLQTFIRELEPFASQQAFRAQMTEADLALPRLQPRPVSSDGLPLPITAMPQAPRPSAPVTTPMGVHGKPVVLDAVSAEAPRVQPAGLASAATRSIPPPRRKPVVALGVAAMLLMGMVAWWLHLGSAASHGASLEVPRAASAELPAPSTAEEIKPAAASERPSEPMQVLAPSAPAPQSVPPGVLPPQTDNLSLPASKAVLRPKSSGPAVRRVRGPNGEFRAGHAFREDFE
jgi:eukaryotic-like serine/threonine-protein kinase